ncbi:ankyrin repeat domain-containing protein [Treponema sp. R80B11-R83G3]
MVILPLAISCLTARKSAPEGETSPVWGLLKKGDDSAKSFFQGEVDVNAVDSDGRSPIFYAVEKKDSELVIFFLSHGANPNVVDSEGQTPLGLCFKNNDPKTAGVLAANGADIHKSIPLSDNATPAVLALETNPAIFTAILNPTTINSTDSDGKTILHKAVIVGNMNAVTELLSASTSSTVLINKKDNDGKNAVDYALERADSRTHIAIAEQLILAGGYCDNPVFAYFGPAVRSANYNIRRNEGLAPIHYAVMDNHAGLVIFLLEKNIDLNIKTTSGATALHEAVRIGNIDIISMLVNSGADVNAMDAGGNTPLHVGIPPDAYLNVLALLVSRGADVNLRDEHGDTPLHIAVMLNRSPESIKLLLNSGGDVYIRNINGKTPLYIAVQERRTLIIPLLIEFGSEIFAFDNNGVTPFDISAKANDGTYNLLITKETVNQRDSSGNTMLHSAVINRAKSEQIGRILDQRALVDSRNKDGDTALHIAVRTNQREIGEYLIVRGANVFSLNSAGDSPLSLALKTDNIREWIINSTTITAKDGLGNNMLHYASEWGLNNAITIIIRSGISVDTQNATGQTPLFLATKCDSPSTLKIFIDNNANLNIRDSQGNSALHAAVRWNANNSISFLISSGMDINANSLNGNTPLHDAIILNLPEIVSLLITQGANLECRNIDGNTPLMEAIRCGVITSVEKLVTNGADTTCRNTRGDTPLHIAVAMERIDIANVLLKTGVSIHARNTRNITPYQTALSISPKMVSTLLENNRIFIPDDYGNSVLHIALLERTSDEIIKAIINQGARINAIDNNGKTPLRLALDLELWQAVKIIADSGADPFFVAADNRSPAEIAFSKGEIAIRAVFSGKAISDKDSSGNTILHYAARLGGPEIISLLLELGANRTIKNISSESPNDIALRWNRRDNSELLR